MASKEPLEPPQKSPCCGRCRNHWVFGVPLKGHKKDCQFRKCKGVRLNEELCGCELIGKRTEIMTEERVLYTPVIDVVAVGDVHEAKKTRNAPKSSKKTSIKTCRMCRAHAKVEPSKGHKRKCPYPTKCGNCEKCKNICKSRDNHGKQRKVERRKPSDRGQLCSKKPNLIKPIPTRPFATNFHDNQQLQHNFTTWNLTNVYHFSQNVSPENLLLPTISTAPMPPYNFPQTFGQGITHSTSLQCYAICNGQLYKLV